MKYAAISYATASTGELIAAPGEGKRLRILGYLLVAAGAVVATLKSGSTALTGAMTLATGTPMVVPPGGTKIDRLPCMECGTNEAFNLTLGGAVQVSGWVVYEVVTG